MKITFLGATKEVTGSNYLVEGAGKKFLVDCGLHQGSDRQELLNFRPFNFNPKEIDFMLLTHAHIDHSGRIPKLYKEGFKSNIYATKATVDLCKIMLPDSGHIQETETEIANKKRKRAGKRDLVEPLYTAKDALDCLEIFSPKQYDEIYEIAEGIKIRFNDAGHMLGSAIIEVWITENGKEEKIVFSGDLGNDNIPLLAQHKMIEEADYLVIESTYGARLHDKNDQKAEMFLDIVAETIENSGTVIIPSFAVGRTQEILYELNKIKEYHLDDEAFMKKYKELMEIPVYVDSPLAVSATEVFRANMDLFSEDIQAMMKSGDNPLEFPGLHFTRTVEDSKALNESTDPCIIISASGMCDVGRIKHHLKHNIWNPTSTILFVGYQAPGTLGRRIVNGDKKVRIFGEEFSVNARVEYIEGYSGHADQNGLIEFVQGFKKQSPKHIFIVHGEPESQAIFKDKLQQIGDFNISIPSYGEQYIIEKSDEKDKDGEFVVKTQKFEDPAQKFKERLELINKMQMLESELEEMKQALKEDIRISTSSDDDMQRLHFRVNDLRKQILEIMNNTNDNNKDNKE